MIFKTRHLVVSFLFLSFALILFSKYSAFALTLPVQDPKPAKVVQPGEEPLDHINVQPLNDEGFYHVTPVFRILEKVVVVKKEASSDASRRTLKDKDWSFDREKGCLEVKAPVNNDKEKVIVYGTRELPWVWKLKESLEPGSVKVLLNDRAGVRGEDFEVDEEKGVIRFLKMDFCDSAKNHYISFGYKRDPENPNLFRGGAIGNHRDRKAVRSFLGLPEEEGSVENLQQSVGTNASFTDDPSKFTLTQPMQTKGLRVAVAKRGEPGNLQWLKADENFTYDEKRGIITLLKDIPLDREKEYLFVSGIPARKNEFFMGEALAKGSVSVYLNNRWLVEGEGFEVDYEAGRITINDLSIENHSAKYYIKAGNQSFGNTVPPEVQ